MGTIKKAPKNTSFRRKLTYRKQQFPFLIFPKVSSFVGIFLILLALPITVIFLQQQTNTSQHAASTSQCQTQKGVCMSKATCQAAGGTCIAGMGCTSPNSYCFDPVVTTQAPIPCSSTSMSWTHKDEYGTNITIQVPGTCVSPSTDSRLYVGIESRATDCGQKGNLCAFEPKVDELFFCLSEDDPVHNSYVNYKTGSNADSCSYGYACHEKGNENRGQFPCVSKSISGSGGTMMIYNSTSCGNQGQNGICVWTAENYDARHGDPQYYISSDDVNGTVQSESAYNDFFSPTTNVHNACSSFCIAIDTVSMHATNPGKYQQGWNTCQLISNGAWNRISGKCNANGSPLGNTPAVCCAPVVTATPSTGPIDTSEDTPTPDSSGGGSPQTTCQDRTYPECGDLTGGPCNDTDAHDLILVTHHCDTDTYTCDNQKHLPGQCGNPPYPKLSISVAVPIVGNDKFSNSNPHTKKRNAKLELYHVTSGKVEASPFYTVTQQLSFDTATGLFMNTAFSLDKIPSSSIGTTTEVFLTMPSFARKELVNDQGQKIITIPNFGQTETLSQATLIPGDLNGDNVINIQDYNALIGCYGDKANDPSSCVVGLSAADLNDDTTIDGIDYNDWLRSFIQLQSTSGKGD